MAQHRSQRDLPPLVKLGINGVVNTAVFLVAWVFMPWWLALILAFAGVLAFIAAEHIDWSAIDWDRLWEW
jgi:hypothetical protein